MSFWNDASFSLILASSSPQRAAILEQIGIPFTVEKPDVDETAPKTVSLERLPAYFAQKKVMAVARKVPEGLVLGVDTAVLFAKQIYGKPEDEKMARSFLEAFSGRRHKVITALTLYDKTQKKLHEVTAEAWVAIAQLSDAMIDWYIGTEEWRGAAGGYRAQGKGARFIQSITGLESTVAGLPVYPLMTLLEKAAQSAPQ